MLMMTTGGRGGKPNLAAPPNPINPPPKNHRKTISDLDAEVLMTMGIVEVRE